jgi:hypothetical protein
MNALKKLHIQLKVEGHLPFLFLGLLLNCLILKSGYLLGQEFSVLRVLANVRQTLVRLFDLASAEGRDSDLNQSPIVHDLVVNRLSTDLLGHMHLHQQITCFSKLVVHSKVVYLLKTGSDNLASNAALSHVRHKIGDGLDAVFDEVHVFGGSLPQSGSYLLIDRILLVVNVVELDHGHSRLILGLLLRLEEGIKLVAQEKKPVLVVDSLDVVHGVVSEVLK